ncbi:beta-ketoacyl synthase N-terminal-like domain-containing protein [Paraglaciecola hydrolytica]|uniref:Ketosynthase family 3 (KS3) domain-containing protein n=1 Tax=Paraglaciecola hydrolytica TaxID=1799789 RepID=A0A136A2E3_9ALTE|nr:beta-ketoacyl synthase N-terminal-like domain-containing protein [Paraglaciecola hydrolytica]KXI29310.1 hypothetical protein AX660_14305 [Paraglaciecola hydrolytica]
MAVYLHSSVSHSACGQSWQPEPLRFVTSPNQHIALGNGNQVLFYAMDKLAIDVTEKRLFKALSASLKALIQQSGLSSQELSQTALLLGSTSLDIGTLTPDTEKAIGLPKIDRLSQYLQLEIGLHPLHMVINTACTASINAVIYGKKLIEQAGFKHVIVIGCEFYNQLTLAGFDSLDLLSQKHLKCFHQQRDGLLLGEGIGALLLSEEKPQKLPCYRILQGHSSCDTYSLTMTAEDGSHIQSVLHSAISQSGLSTSDIDLVKVHGTATYNNDIAEYHALQRCFTTPAPIFALKPYIGHTLGACGAIEMALMDRLLQQDYLPVPEYVEQESELIMLAFAPKTKPLRDYKNVLINHCGFGGNNAAIVLETQQP